MTTLNITLLIVHVVVGAMIIGLVLIQRGKGAEAGAAFGTGVSGTVFGARGSANFLSRSTAILATVFFLTSLGLTYLGTQERPQTSILDAVPAPATPAPPLPAVPAGQAPGTNMPALPATPEQKPAGN